MRPEICVSVTKHMFPCTLVYEAAAAADDVFHSCCLSLISIIAKYYDFEGRMAKWSEEVDSGVAVSDGGGR